MYSEMQYWFNVNTLVLIPINETGKNGLSLYCLIKSFGLETKYYSWNRVGGGGLSGGSDTNANVTTVNNFVGW